MDFRDVDGCVSGPWRSRGPGPSTRSWAWTRTRPSWPPRSPLRWACPRTRRRPRPPRGTRRSCAGSSTLRESRRRARASSPRRGPGVAAEVSRLPVRAQTHVSRGEPGSDPRRRRRVLPERMGPDRRHPRLTGSRGEGGARPRTRSWSRSSSRARRSRSRGSCREDGWRFSPCSTSPIPSTDRSSRKRSTSPRPVSPRRRSPRCGRRRSARAGLSVSGTVRSTRSSGSDDRGLPSSRSRRARSGDSARGHSSSDGNVPGGAGPPARAVERRSDSPSRLPRRRRPDDPDPPRRAVRASGVEEARRRCRGRGRRHLRPLRSGPGAAPGGVALPRFLFGRADEPEAGRRRCAGDHRCLEFDLDPLAGARPGIRERPPEGCPARETCDVPAGGTGATAPQDRGRGRADGGSQRGRRGRGRGGHRGRRRLVRPAYAAAAGRRGPASLGAIADGQPGALSCSRNWWPIPLC